MRQDHRHLTHDEKKTAEAAFEGSPFAPKWSETARKVYLGLSAAIANKRYEALQEMRSSQPTRLASPEVPESNQRSRVTSTLR